MVRDVVTADREDWLNVRDLIDRVEIYRHELVVRLDQTRCGVCVVTSHSKLRLAQLERDGDTVLSV